MELKDWLNAVNFTKEDLTEHIKEYPPYIVNRCLSGHLDCVLFANEMNKYHFLDKDMQFNFYINILRKRKRFSPWVRKEKVSDLEFVKSYYGYNNEKASQALKILSKEQLDYIKQKLDIGVASRKEKKLYQSCHILHKQGKYYIVHFKELFALDGKYANITVNDVQRRNRITRLLADWGLISVVKEDSIMDIAPLNQIKVLPYRDKNEWTLEQKYNIGKKGKQQEEG